MALLVRNHVQSFRPLRGGIGIVNGTISLLGTLGCIATSDGQDRWILSAYHVLIGMGRAAVSGEAIFQPAPGAAMTPVALTDATRADPLLDAAAALVSPAVGALGEILGIGGVAGVAAPVVGMRVAKSGIATGITEGIITDVTGARVTIEQLPGYPSKYELSSISDSGAVWVEQSSGSAVALHVAGNDTGIEVAIGTSLPDVLASLRLAVV